MRSVLGLLSALAAIALAIWLNQEVAFSSARQVVPGCTALDTSYWISQLSLLDESSYDRWVYLSGNASCRNVTLCQEYDTAVIAIRQNAQLLPNTLSFVDCDADPVLCYSWLVQPPALMHIVSSKDSQTKPTGRSNVIMQPIQLPVSNSTQSLPEQFNDATANQTITYIMSDEFPIENVEVWDGFLNPFTGALGKYGGGILWGKVKYRLGWLPVSQQTLIIGVLLLVRLFIRKIGPSQTEVTAADMVVPPGSLD
ncbi:hypothetical protein PV11_04087 [Exophiala sideris]|uniref:Uncharacterized protein n=1 Tax=Exophiala sideris TaxID=1016849 RepID=A0A0D1VZT4_9EURO|nr:hypothetical protein PV11_04087 [Exophiala sideris]